MNGATPARCTGCRNGAALDFQIGMAFHPIVSLSERRVWAYEALVRGEHGESAFEVLSRVNDDNRYVFDQRCRVAAITDAVAAGLLADGAKLSINFLPNAVYSPKACIQLTLKTAADVGLPVDRLIFEFTENEQMGDPDHVMGIVETYQAMGFITAIDDFGAGHSQLGLLAKFRPDMIKLDMDLLRGIDASPARRLIVDSLVRLAAGLGVGVIAEGVETASELAVVEAIGIDLVQGFLFAKPAFRALPEVNWPGTHATACC
jgi:EAL domain-containing protein (putative c-di-GMP-specific phosphodiesterase class I)